jgi:hypothetical protein
VNNELRFFPAGSKEYLHTAGAAEKVELVLAVILILQNQRFGGGF